MLFAYWHKNVGCYDLLHPNEKEVRYSVDVKLPGHDRVSISASWSLDDAPDIDDDAIIEDIIDMIEIRLDKYLYSSSREKDKQKLEFLKENMGQILEVWAQSQIEIYEKEISRLQSKVRNLKHDYLEDDQ